MISFHTILKFIVGHVLAGAVVILGTLLVTLVCYVVGISTTPDGIDTPAAEVPAFLMLMLTVFLAAITASTGSFVISVFLTWLRTRWKFPAWLPVLVIPSLAFLVLFLIFGRSKDIGFIGLLTGAVFFYFGLYWTLLASSSALLDFLRRKLWKQKAA